MKTIRRAIGTIDNTKTKALENGVVEVTISTGARDRHGEIVDVKGMNTKDYNGVVLWGHDYYSMPIGKSLSLRKTKDGKLISKAQLAVDEYEFAATVYKLIQGGYITDASVGFMPQEYDPATDTWTKSTLVEWSFVSIGANPEAKVSSKALASVGLSKDEFEAQVKAYQLAVKEMGQDEDTETTDEIVEDEDEVTTPPAPTPPADPLVDKDQSLSNNVRHHLDAIKSLVSATESELNDLDTQDTEQHDTAETKTVRKRLVLVRSKKTLNSVDKIVELAIGEIKKQLK